MIEKTSWFKNQAIYRYVRLQAENKKLFKYLEVGATFLLITIFLTTAIAPTASAISKLLGELKSKEITSNSMRQKLINVITAQDYYAQAQEQFQILESSYPSNPEFYQTASTFSSISKQSNTSIKQLKYNLSNTQEDLSYGVNLIIDGSYQNFLSLINQVSQGRRLIDIDSITISQSDNNLNLNLSTNLVYLPSSNND
jgi:Tfp pilus assembly protein PilO